MTECFILAAGDGHVRAYRFKKRPEGHGIFVGRLPFLRKGGDIYITTDESGILPTLPGYVEEFPHDNMDAFSMNHPFVWKAITSLHKDAKRMHKIATTDIPYLNNLTYSKDLLEIRNDPGKLGLVMETLKTIIDRHRSSGVR